MRIQKRVVAVLASTALAIVPMSAYADTISNNLDASVDAVAEAMPLTVGGALGVTQLYVTPQNGDGKNGCNLAARSTLTVGVSSSDSSVATVGPSSVTFASCSDAATLTVTPVHPGTAQIKVTQTDNTTSGSFDLAPATFTVDVSAPPNHAPTVAVAGVVGGATYAKGAVPTATCQAADAEDGASSFPATLSPVTGPDAADGLGSQSASCSYTDAGGLTAAGAETYSIVDPTAPVITRQATPPVPDGDNDWYTGNVSLTWTVSEPESPNSLIKTGCADQDITADQDIVTYSCSATSAGGTAAQQNVQIKRDATAPTAVTFAGGPVDGAAYFPNSVPAAGSCTATDATSGLASCVVSGHSTALGDHALTATATDRAGNTATATLHYTVRKLDLIGFFQPVDMGGVLNTVKAGSTVPLKFRVYDRGVEQRSTAIVSAIRSASVPCSSTATQDAVEETVSSASALRYDTTGGQFVQNWKTPTGAGTCYRVTLTTVDDSSVSALFKLK